MFLPCAEQTRHNLAHMKRTTSPLKYSINRARCRFALLIPLALACFAFASHSRATCQDACLANYNTAQGDNALVNLTTGRLNTAFGTDALLSMTTAFGNTAFGAEALRSDTDGYSNTAVGQYSLFF